MTDKTLYTEESIESLSPLEFTRLRPGVYAGDTTYSTQLAVEIFSNAVDEYRLGHGNKVEVGIKGTKIRITHSEMMEKQSLKPRSVFSILLVNIEKMAPMKELHWEVLVLVLK